MATRSDGLLCRLLIRRWYRARSEGGPPTSALSLAGTRVRAGLCKKVPYADTV